jgi:type I restriction enzyme R subunit
MANAKANNEFTYVEDPFLAHLEKAGWTVERWKGGKGCRREFDEIILDEVAKAALLRLNPCLTDSQADDLITELNSFDVPKLIDRNREGDKRLAVGLSAYNEETGDNETVRLIDYADPTNNSFLAVSQFRIQQLEKEIVPDIVLFVNGLPLIVVECKSSTLKEPFFDGVAQIERYKQDFPALFDYNQFVVSTCRQIAKYTTITGNVENYLEWKEPYPFLLSDIDPSGGIVPSQEKLVWGMLSVGNFLDIVRNYTVWDGAIKKVPRYMQYRGARKIVERIRADRKGGTIWHTQGSGKSLSMMYVIRQMHHSDDLKDWKIVLIVDRDDLEKQLRQTSEVLGYSVNVAKSIEGAKQLLSSDTSDITLAMIHKFGETAEKDGQKKKVSVFPELNTSDKILVMIDEAHRSEYGELAAGMIKAMPNAVRMAFTGTPITATTNIFGGVLDTYTMRQAVEDGVVMEICYEGRAENSTIIDDDAMNGKFVDIFGYADDEEKQDIMRRYTLKKYMEADAVIRAKATDMLEHYIGTVFQNGFKAQVAAFNREAAYRYKRAFEDLIAAKIVALEKNNPDGIDIALLEKLKVECIISSGTDDANLHPHLKALVDSTNKDAVIGEDGSFKTSFAKGGYTGIIIVSDMLLTGFDAPVEQVLYLDKKLVNHNLLQAIARVNRTCGKDKTCGYIVDYVGITQHLNEALSEYVSLEGVAEEDKDPMLSVSEDIDHLNSAYNEILTFVRDEVCYDIETQTESVVEELVAAEDLRDEYNDLFKKLSKYYDRVLPNPVALQYRDGYKKLAFIRESVANRTRDPRYSMKDASAKVRAIIEEYLDVSGVGIEVPPIDILSPDFIAGVKTPNKSDRAVVDELEYAVREYIIENTPRDPELFERFSEHLNEILESLKGNWQALRKTLENFIKSDLYNARNAENTYGYEAVKEMPFFSLLRKEVFGDKKFEDLTVDEFNVLKTLTDDCLSRLKTDTAKRDFWEHDMQIRQTRAEIRTKLLDMEVTAPSISGKINDIVQKIIELGREHYK